MIHLKAFAVGLSVLTLLLGIVITIVKWPLVFIIVVGSAGAYIIGRAVLECLSERTLNRNR